MRIELTHGALTAAADTHGGELVSLREGGIEYIWKGDPAFWPGRNPLLFPIVGNLKGGCVRFDGVPFEMNRHGFARTSEFTVAEREADRVLLELRENEDTLKHYPFPFSLQVEHRLTDGGFTTAFTVKNTGDRPMPFCIGAHTGFSCPLLPGERFEDYELVFPQDEQADTLLVTADGLISHDCTQPMLTGGRRLPLDRAVFSRLDTIILREHRSRSVSLLHRHTGRGVRMDFDGFPLLAFWTPGGKEAPFLCIEPWHGCAALDNESGEFTDKPGCILLPPAGVHKLAYTVTIVGTSHK